MWIPLIPVSVPETSPITAQRLERGRGVEGRRLTGHFLWRRGYRRGATSTQTREEPVRDSPRVAVWWVIPRRVRTDDSPNPEVLKSRSPTPRGWYGTDLGKSETCGLPTLVLTPEVICFPRNESNFVPLYRSRSGGRNVEGWEGVGVVTRTRGISSSRTVGDWF